MKTFPTRLKPEETQAVFGAALREVHGADARLEQWTAHPLARGKHRAVRYDLDARVANGVTAHHCQWVGKFYERNDDARRVATVLRELATTDCAARGGMVIPRVLAQHAPLHLLLLTYESGQTVTSALEQHGTLVLRAIGRALAALHTTPVTRAGVTPAADPLGDLRPGMADLCARFPAETVSLPDRLVELERQTPRGPAVPSLLHGDLGPAQLLWQAGRIVVLDFDKCGRGDPALDLGNLLTQFRRITLRKPDKLADYASLRRDLLEAYQHWAPPDPGLARRVAWYEQIALLRKVRFLATDMTRHKDADQLRQRQVEAFRLLRALPSGLESDDRTASCSTMIEAGK